MTPTTFRTLLAIALLVPSMALAQKIAFVDTKYILDQMPDYAAAQQELDHQSGVWQKEIDERWNQIKRMRDAYNAEAILLTEDMKRTRAEDIEKKEREARELQKKRFGVEGDLFKKRQELVQPIQDRIYEAVKEVAGTSYVAIFDIGGMGNNVLYASDKYDKSDSVLRKLGIKPGTSKNSGNLNEEEPSETPDDTKDGGGQQDEPKDGGGRDGGSPPPPDKPKQ